MMVRNMRKTDSKDFEAPKLNPKYRIEEETELAPREYHEQFFYRWSLSFVEDFGVLIV